MVNYHVVKSTATKRQKTPDFLYSRLSRVGSAHNDEYLRLENKESSA